MASALACTDACCTLTLLPSRVNVSNVHARYCVGIAAAILSKCLRLFQKQSQRSLASTILSGYSLCATFTAFQPLPLQIGHVSLVVNGLLCWRLVPLAVLSSSLCHRIGASHTDWSHARTPASAYLWDRAHLLPGWPYCNVEVGVVIVLNTLLRVFNSHFWFGSQ
jgi:hypothetical protein